MWLTYARVNILIFFSHKIDINTLDINKKTRILISYYLIMTVDMYFSMFNYSVYYVNQGLKQSGFLNCN